MELFRRIHCSGEFNYKKKNRDKNKWTWVLELKRSNGFLSVL